MLTFTIYLRPSQICEIIGLLAYIKNRIQNTFNVKFDSLPVIHDKLLYRQLTKC